MPILYSWPGERGCEKVTQFEYINTRPPENVSHRGLSAAPVLGESSSESEDEVRTGARGPKRKRVPWEIIFRWSHVHVNGLAVL